MKCYWVLLICMICLTTSPSFAFGGYSALITPIENSFYGVDYAEEKDEARLQRLEETVYGEAKTGDIKTRLNKLREDISADMIGKEIEARPDTFADDSPKTAYSDSYTDRQTPTEPTVYKEDSSVSYPVVDTMEQIVFKKEYKNSDINNRLTKLEQEVYKQIYPSDDLYTRVDRLKKSLLIEEDKYLANYQDVFSDDNPTYQDFEDYQPNYNRNYNTQQYYSYDNNGSNYNDNKKLSLDDIEKSVLKKRYKNDDVNTRLSRIENKLFQTDFQEDDESTRLNRISMAHTAQKASNAYKGAGLQEKMATVMQIGMTVLMILAMVL